MQIFRFNISTLALLSALSFTPLAQATLGEPFVPATMAAQAKPVGAIRMKAQAQGKYTVNEYTLVSGTIVREFVSPSNQVFAVTWRGPFKPNLQQLLGTRFARYLEASAHKANPGRKPVSLRSGDLVLHGMGHMRDFFGMAYLPGQLPAGVTETELQP